MSDTAQNFSKITSYLVTKDACVDLIKKLHSIQDAGYLQDTSNLVPMFLSLSKEYDNLLAPEFDDATPVSSVLAYTERLISYLESLEYVEITLAFHPGKNFLDRLYLWFQSYLSVPFYLHVLVDESIGGGLLLSYKGVYADLSLKKAISDYFITHKDYVSTRI